MVINCDSVFPELMRLNLLPSSYKDWLYQQLDPETQIDETALLGLRLMLKVSTIILQYFKRLLLQIQNKSSKIYFVHTIIVVDCRHNCLRFNSESNQ